MSILAGVILTKNEEKHIGECLDSLAWLDRRVVFDSFSTDRTCDIAREHGTEVVQHPFTDYASQRNAAIDMIDAEWIFFVDADERSTPELAEEIGTLPLSKTGEGQGMGVTGYYVPRENYLFGKLTRGSGYWPDYQMRLLKRGHARYERPASEIVSLEGQSGHLKNPLIHYNYESIAQFHQKQTFRIDFEATNLFKQGVRPKFYSPYAQYVRHFWWRFKTLKGYQDGFHGFRLSMLLAYYFGYRTYRRLAELWKNS
jgi:(heptosyl)LPS beta-1,4-glucosyltransferase